MVAQRRRPWQLAVAERVKQAVYAIWPRAWCDVFGSIASGLAAPGSDVDMVIRGVTQPDRVRVLAAHLARQDWVMMLQAVEHTAVPVVKFSTAAIPISFGNQGNLIVVDITFENERHNGLNTCGVVRQLVQRWPALKPLVLVLKQFLAEKGLNDPYLGGISSYGLVLMVAAILVRRGNANTDLGESFVDFLETYSSPEFLRRGVSLSGSTSELRRPLHDPVFIEDPLDPTNNVGRSCYGINLVIAAFAEARDAIMRADLEAAALTLDTPPPEWSYLGRVFSTAHHALVVQLVTSVWCPPEVPTGAPGLPPSSASAGPAWVPARRLSAPPLPPGHPSAAAATTATATATAGAKPPSRSGSVVGVSKPSGVSTPATVAAPPPRATGASSLPSPPALEWNRTARELLARMKRDVDVGALPFCPACRVRSGAPHAPGCGLLHLLSS